MNAPHSAVDRGSDPLPASEQAEVGRWRRLNARLAEGLALARDEREHWLRELAQHEPAEAAALRALLARAVDGTDRFMSRHAAPMLAAALVDGEAATDRAEDIVGPYRLIRELGRGGMGTVWLAERADGAVQRQVAVKLPLVAWAPGVAARLQQERDSLAALEHPHIARLYDAGTTAAGRPYLAMEYVDGLPIDVHARESAATIDDRLRLFLQVAQAVTYAHARLIVHRDLKPSNILVTRTGDVRLLDFGAAKLLNDTSADAGLTRIAGRAFSPDYASPEQILGETITVASDVYSAGVVLYELLTGRRPYCLPRPTLGALEEAILAARVPPPSSIVDDRRIAGQLRGDLDAILAKALRRHARDRYANMEALADDVQRYLADEPVHAQPQGRWYYVRKFTRRHRGAVVAGGIVVATLALGGGAAIWQARIARAEAQRAAQVKQFVASIFTQAVPRSGSGGEVTASDLLAAAAERIETELADEPAVAAELGLIVGISQDALGHPEQVEQPLRAALPRAEREFGPRHPLTLQAQVRLATAIAPRDPALARRYVAQAIPQALAGLPGTARLAADALEEQAFIDARLEQAGPSYAALRQAIALREKYLGRLSEDAIWGLGLLSNTYGRFGDYRPQLQTATEAYHRAQAAFGDQRPHNTLISVERWYAEALRNNDRPRESVPLLRHVLYDQQQLDAAPTVRVRNARLQLARSLIAVGWLEEALPLARSAVELEQAQNPGETEDRRATADTLVTALVAARRSEEAAVESGRARAVAARLGSDVDRIRLRQDADFAALLAQQGRFAEASALAGQIARRAPAKYSAIAARARITQAFVSRMQRRPAEALAIARVVAQDAKFATWGLALQSATYAEIGAALLDLGRFDAATDALRQCQVAFGRAQIEPSVQVADCLIANARTHLQAGRAAEAERLLLPLSRQWQRLHSDAVWQGETLYWLSQAQARLGRHDEAAANRALSGRLIRAGRMPALTSLLDAAAPAALPGQPDRSPSATHASRTRPVVARPPGMAGAARPDHAQAAIAVAVGGDR